MRPQEWIINTKDRQTTSYRIVRWTGWMYCSGVLHHIERWNILWPSWRNFDCIIQYTPSPYNPKSCPEDPPPLCAMSSFLLFLLLGTVYSSSSILSNLSLHHVSTWFPFLRFHCNSVCVSLAFCPRHSLHLCHSSSFLSSSPSGCAETE